MAPLRSSGFIDPGWEHGICQDEKKKKVKCNYCGKIVSGGIYRLKQHLARISGEVTFCRKAPDEVCEKMKENLAGSQAIKKHRRYNDDDQASMEIHSNDDNDVADEISNRSLVACSVSLRAFGYVDPGWEHGVAQDARKKKVKCNYCDKIVSGGINRFKQHLARIPGEVASCRMAPDHVYVKMKENMKWHRTGRRHVPELDDVDADHDDVSGELLNREGNGVLVSFKGRRRRSRGNEWDLQSKALSEKQSSQEVVSAIAKFFYHTGVPLDAADSVYFQEMLNVVGRLGPGWKSPEAQALSGTLLQEEVESIKKSQMDMKGTWGLSGCSIMVDRWNDAADQTTAKFFVSSSQGTFFVSSIDSTDFCEDPSSTFELMDRIVGEVGDENVVQVVTDGSPAFTATGRMLEEKRKKLFWTPCAYRSLDQVLENFLSLKFFKDCISKAQTITCLIYNHFSLLSIAKEFTAGNELLYPARTRPLAAFLSLSCLFKHQNALRRMFQSSKWASSEFAESEEGKQAKKIVLNLTFWKKIQYVTKLTEPIVRIMLKFEDRGRLNMASIYDEMNMAKISIKELHGRDERKYAPFIMIMETHLNPLFHHPLIACAYFLNPSLRYNPDFLLIPEVIQGVNECIARMEPISDRRILITDFISAKDEFGTELAVGSRTEMDPVAWWQRHGTNCGELQRIAVRILGQTCCSIPACYRRVSNGPTRNQLARKLQADLMFVRYNLNLQDGQPLCPRPHQVFLHGLMDGWLCESGSMPPWEEDEEAAEKCEEEGEASDVAFPDMVELPEFQHGAGRDDAATSDIGFFGDDS